MYDKYRDALRDRLLLAKSNVDAAPSGDEDAAYRWMAALTDTCLALLAAVEVTPAPILKNDKQELQDFQLQNCDGCRFADEARVGTEEPCCTFPGPIQQASGICQRRRPADT